MSLDEKDLGIGKLQAQLAELGGMRLTFGYQGASGKAKHPGTKDKTIAQVAQYAEFGTSTAPARPLGRHTMEENREKFADLGKKVIRDLIDGRAHDPAAAVEGVGEEVLRALRKTIDRSRDWAEANAASTIAAKGHDQPLIGGYGTLYDQASWAVRDKGFKIVKQGGEG